MHGTNVKKTQTHILTKLTKRCDYSLSFS